MIIKCPRCDARYNITKDRITYSGIKLKCSKCNVLFLAKRKNPSITSSSQSRPLSQEPIGLNTFKVAIGHSDDVDSLDAIKEAINQCKAILKGLKPQAGMLFSAIGFDHNLILKKIDEEFPGTELIGCTTDGEISSILDFTEDSVHLILFYSDVIQINAGLGRSVSADPLLAAKQAVNEAKTKSSLESTLCITTPESLTTSSVSILNGLQESLGLRFPIFGGTAGDQYQFEKTYQFYKTEVLSDALPILLFSGPLLYSSGVASGWAPVSKKHIVTEVEKNVVYKLDDKRALDIYRHYLGKDVTSFSEYPLAVLESGKKNFYLRAALTCDEEHGSITFAGDVPINTTVQIAEANRENILKGANKSIAHAVNDYPGLSPEVTFIFSCAARKWLLGTRVKEECLIVKDCIKNDTNISGFYTYGEIGPFGKQSPAHFHNETFVTLLMGIR